MLDNPQEEMVEPAALNTPQEEGLEMMAAPAQPLPPSAMSDRNLQMLQDPTSFVADRVKEFMESEQALNPWKNRIIKYYELYQMVQSNRNYDGLAKIFVPEILRAVETLVGKLNQIICGGPNWVEFSGREPSDDGSAQCMTELDRFQMDANNFKARLLDCLRQLCIAGLTVRKIGWDFKQVSRTRRDKETGRPIHTVDTVSDHWTFDPVDLLSFHISDINTPYNDIQKARWIGEQYQVDKEWIYERMRRGWFSSLRKADVAKLGKASGGDAKSLRDRRNRASGYNPSSQDDKPEILERWGLLPAKYVHTPEELMELGLEPDEQVETVCIIANRDLILKLEANPFWHGQKPYVACPYVAKEGEFGGMGVAQIGEKLQEELNDTRNQTMDNKTLILMTMWLKSRASGIKNDQLRIRPQGVVSTNDMNGLQPLRPPVLTGVGVNIEGVVKEDLRQSVGAASNLQGIATGGVDTATESSIINRESLGRLMLTAEMYSELILKPTFVFAEHLNYQFYDHVKAIKVVGENGARFKSLAPEDIQSTAHKDVVINLSVDAAENPAVRRQQLMNFLTIVQQLPPQAIEFHWKLLDKAYGMFFHGRSLSEVYTPPALPEELLTPDQEIDMVMAEQPVLAKNGQDHKTHLMVLEQFMQNTQYALSQASFDILKALITSHYELLMQELAQAQAMQEMQMLQAMQGMEGGGPDKRAPNASPFTQSPAPQPQDIVRESTGGSV